MHVLVIVHSFMISFLKAFRRPKATLYTHFLTVNGETLVNGCSQCILGELMMFG